MVQLRATQHRAESFVRLQPIQILDAVATSQVQEDHGHHHLGIRPSLRTIPGGEPLPDGLGESRHVGQVQVGGQTGKRRHSLAAALDFVLDREDALCHCIPASLPVMTGFSATPF